MTTATEKQALKLDAAQLFAKLDAKVQAATTTAESYLTVTGANGTFAPEAYEKLLEQQGVDKETYIRVQEANAVIYPALAAALGHKGVPVLKENAEVNNIVAVMNAFGKDVISVGLKRSNPYTLRDSDGKVTGTGTSYGVLTVDHKIYGTKTRGQMAQVKGMIGELATASLST